MRKPDISVIIPTYHRLSLLRKTLRSLQKQTLTSFEVIVVDNGCQKPVAAMVKSFKNKFPHSLVYLPEPQLGFHHALHAGAKRATSDLLFFTNDDVVISRECLRAYWRTFTTHSEMAAAGGSIRPTWGTRLPNWLKAFIGHNRIFPPYSLMDLGPSFRLSRKGFFFETNMAIRKEVLFRGGGFNPELFGQQVLGDGETGLNRKLWQLGQLIGYVPEALVYHQIEGSRMTKEFLLTWFRRTGACDVYTITHEGGIPRHWVDFLRFYWSLTTVNLKYWFGWLLFKSLTASPLLKVNLLWARTQGQLHYWRQLKLDPALQKLVRRTSWLTQ